MKLLKVTTRRAGPPSLSLRKFHEQRNKVLVIRRLGGLGDVLVHRMIFEDFKRLMPDCHLVFACPKQFHDSVRDHPFLDEVADSETVDLSEFTVSYDTTSPCLRYEMAMAPGRVIKHRADIWANHCGVLCLRHDMHLRVPEEYREWGRRKVAGLTAGGGIPVLFTPVSYDTNRTLTDAQLRGVVEGMRGMGCAPYSAHTGTYVPLEKLGVPTVTDASLPEWLGLIDASPYVVTVDTSVFHAAGGLKKPMVGIFTFADGMVRGQYFDFVLVQRHRFLDGWDCGPCFNPAVCPKSDRQPRPCLTELTAGMILDGVGEMFRRWPVETATAADR
jgi:hypothetical protein